MRDQPNATRKICRLLGEAGVATSIIHGHPRRSILLDFLENARGRTIAEGFAARAELATLINQLRVDLDDPRRLVVSHLSMRSRAAGNRSSA